MASPTLADWVKVHRADIFKECALAAHSQQVAAPADRALAPLCHVVLDALASEHMRSRALLAWAHDCQAWGIALPDALRVSAVARAAVEAAVRRQDGAPRAQQARDELHMVFEQIVQHLAESYALQGDPEHGAERADRALDRLNVVYDISQAFSSALTDDMQVLDLLAAELSQGLAAAHCAIWLSDLGPPIPAALYARDPAFAPVLPDQLTDSAFADAMRGAPVRVLVRGEGLTPPDTALLDGLQAHTLLLAPLFVQEIAIGVLTLSRDATGPVFDAAEVTLVASAITQAEIAVQNAGLYAEIRHLNRSLEIRVASRTRELQREKEHVQTLYAIGQELSTSLDLDQTLEDTLRLVTHAVGAAHGAIVILEHEAQALTYAARMGDLDLALSDAWPTPGSAGTGIIPWVIDRRQPVLILDAAHDARCTSILACQPQLRSLIASPLVVGEDLHGVLVVAGDQPRAFDPEQQRLVTAAAHQIAQAVHNALLYRREQEDRSKTQAMLQSIADGVIVNDMQDRVIAINAAAQEILGERADAVLGQSVWRLFDVFESNGRRAALSALSQISAAPLSAVGSMLETTLETEDKVVSARMAPVVSETSQALGVVTALRDITREVEADRAKSEFVSTVSHELRTPLTSIKGYTDLIYVGAVGMINEQQRRFLAIIRNNSDRLTALINDLLDISRIDSGRVHLQIEPHDPTDIVREVVDSMRDQIHAKGLVLNLDLPEGLPEIMGDRVRLVQVVTNLMNNALKYTDAGWIGVSLSTLGGAVRLDVADSGIGIARHDQGRIFERFYRADTPVMEGRGGTGLGLSIAKELVELHGGRVWVKSEVGVGSTFTVVLPAATHDLPASVDEEPSTGAPKILVVDDERDILALLRHQLTTQGYHVITASTGSEAIARAEREQPDLITLDIFLPDRHGFDVLRELKERPETQHIPVIILTVAQDETNGYRLGALDYIVKPLDERRLLDSISRILERKGTILIADDAESTAKMLIDVLSRYGYQPILAMNGYEALAAARRERPDLILLDLRMPGMDGYEALTRLKKDPETRQIPILVMSAHAADPVQERLRLKRMGASDFLAKPFSLEDLLVEVQRVAFGAA
ncbi:MAG: response regulator [Anaerolineae bacterium]|nr:response regulator [Anaerolineae bacterium]